jgi:hypothetical protein
MLPRFSSPRKNRTTHSHNLIKSLPTTCTCRFRRMRSDLDILYCQPSTGKRSEPKRPSRCFRRRYITPCLNQIMASGVASLVSRATHPKNQSILIATRLFKRGESFNGIVEAHRTKPSSHSIRGAHQTQPVPTSNRAKYCRHHVARASKSRPPMMDGLEESETFTDLAFDQRQYS